MSPEPPWPERTHAVSGIIPAVEDADELGAHRFTRTAELERQIADQAAEQEVAGLVFVGERMEEAGDSLLRRPVRVKDRHKPGLDIGPIVFEDRRGERLLAGEVRVERSLRHACAVGDVLDAAGGESARVHEVEARRQVSGDVPRGSMGAAYIQY